MQPERRNIAFSIDEVVGKIPDKNDLIKLAIHIKNIIHDNKEFDRFRKSRLAQYENSNDNRNTK